jgi:hypothetical protein
VSIWITTNHLPRLGRRSRACLRPQPQTSFLEHSEPRLQAAVVEELDGAQGEGVRVAIVGHGAEVRAVAGEEVSAEVGSDEAMLPLNLLLKYRLEM